MFRHGVFALSQLFSSWELIFGQTFSFSHTLLSLTSDSGPLNPNLFGCAVSGKQRSDTFQDYKKQRSQFASHRYPSVALTGLRREKTLPNCCQKSRSCKQISHWTVLVQSKMFRQLMDRLAWNLLESFIFPFRINCNDLNFSLTSHIITGSN